GADLAGRRRRRERVAGAAAVRGEEALAGRRVAGGRLHDHELVAGDGRDDLLARLRVRAPGNHEAPEEGDHHESRRLTHARAILKASPPVYRGLRAPKNAASSAVAIATMGTS